MSNNDGLSDYRALAAKLIHAALSILRDNGKEMPVKVLFSKVEQSVQLNEWAREVFKKSGYVRWKSVLHFYSINCTKAGYLVKNQGVWFITPEGETALKLSPKDLLIAIEEAFAEWYEKNKKETRIAEISEEPEKQEVITFENIQQIALEEFENFIDSMNPYEFQALVAALLRGMGYYTPIIAPKGPDGGVDIIAYRDPIGSEIPRIKVQVKHQDSSVGAPAVSELKGQLVNGEVGLFVSMGGFTPDAKRSVVNTQNHIELIDLARFIGLWQKYYEKMTDEDKSLMPLKPLYFLANKD